MKNKYCDLNVIESTTLKQNVDNVKKLLQLGYHTIALSRIIPSPNKNNKLNIKEGVNLVSSMKKLHEKIIEDLKIFASLSDNDFKLPNDFKLLSRVTIAVSDAQQIRNFRDGYYKEIITGFDLIALQPENEKVFRVVMEGKFTADIVVVPLESRIDFDLPVKSMRFGIDLGLRFEICYANAIKSLALRKYIFNNALRLTQKTKQSKGIIISSGGSNFMDFRSPPDVVNLSNLFGIKGGACQDVVEAFPQQAVFHSYLRNKTFHGALQVEKLEDKLKCEPQSKKRKLEELNKNENG